MDQSQERNAGQRASRQCLHERYGLLAIEVEIFCPFASKPRWLYIDPVFHTFKTEERLYAFRAFENCLCNSGGCVFGGGSRSVRQFPKSTVNRSEGDWIRCKETSVRRRRSYCGLGSHRNRC